MLKSIEDEEFAKDQTRIIGNMYSAAAFNLAKFISYNKSAAKNIPESYRRKNKKDSELLNEELPTEIVLGYICMYQKISFVSN